MSARTSQRVSHRRPVGRASLGVVAMVFVAAFGVLQTAVIAASHAGLLGGLMRGTASMASALVASVGIPVTHLGVDLFLPNHVLRIDVGCTAISLVALFVAAVIAYPLSMRSRFTALAVGIPVIALANQVRLLGVALASQYLDAQAFAFAHDYLFMVVMVFVVVALWAAWIEKARVDALS